MAILYKDSLFHSDQKHSLSCAYNQSFLYFLSNPKNWFFRILLHALHLHFHEQILQNSWRMAQQLLLIFTIIINLYNLYNLYLNVDFHLLYDHNLLLIFILFLQMIFQNCFILLLLFLQQFCKSLLSQDWRHTSK